MRIFRRSQPSLASGRARKALQLPIAARVLPFSAYCKEQQAKFPPTPPKAPSPTRNHLITQLTDRAAPILIPVHCRRSRMSLTTGCAVVRARSEGHHGRDVAGRSLHSVLFHSLLSRQWFQESWSPIFLPTPRVLPVGHSGPLPQPPSPSVNSESPDLRR